MTLDPNPTALDLTLQSSQVTVAARREIASRLWGYRGAWPSREGAGSDPYFSYYSRQSHFFDPGCETFATTHRDIIDIANLLQQNLKRDAVKQSLQAKFGPGNSSHENQKLESSIDLATRLLVMLRVGGHPDSFSPFKPLSWEQGTSLQEFMSNTFSPPKILLKGRIKLEKSFTARNLVRIAKMKIVWTDNLADHLRILDEDTQIAIFHHASFLEVVRNR